MNRTSKHIHMYEKIRGNYPALSKAANIMPPPPATILGRDLSELRRGLRNPEKANVALLAEPGTGKTAYVQGFAYDEESLKYYLVLEVNPERLIEKDGDRDNALLVGFNELLDQASKYSHENNVIIVLFIDEFHKMMKISPSLMESLKPRLEKSALHGFRLIVATTFQEYSETIATNRALDQRFLQIKLSELPKDAVIKVLENRAKQHGVLEQLDKNVLEDIYVESKRILMSNAQPRASIDILNSMIGDIVKCEHMENGRLVKEFFTPAEMNLNSEKVLSRPLLKRIIKRAHGIDIDNTVDVKNVINALKTRLFNQDNAIEVVVHLLEMAAQGFSDLSRPKFSFLSTGATGVGKALPDTWDIPAPVPGGYIKNGDLKVGDLIYSRIGKPEPVTGVYPRGEMDVYLVTLSDGRQIECGGDHLWSYRRRGSLEWDLATTEELMKRKLVTCSKGKKWYNADHKTYNYMIPMNHATEREPSICPIDPYVFGAIFAGLNYFGTPLYFFEDNILKIGDCNPETAAEIGSILGVKADNFAVLEYAFPVEDNAAAQFLSEFLERTDGDHDNLFIPDVYKYGSIEQRRALVQGLFDRDGHIYNKITYGLEYRCSSRRFLEDLQEILWSLGYSSVIKPWTGRSLNEYKIEVNVPNHEKAKFFRTLSKQETALEVSRKTRLSSLHEVVFIKSIKKLVKRVPMTCIMVGDDEHLYLAGKEHIVTHNTEMAKIISETMQIPLKRFDMSRYGDPKMAKEFADALFHAAWSTPNCYLLIDEVEKSSKRAMNILLQVLDDARLTDSVNPDRIASFTGCIINLTTNVGSEIYQNMQKFQDATAEADAELVYEALCHATDSDGNPLFETAVLGRVDEIVPFHPLPVDAMEKIALRTLVDSIENAETNRRKIVISPDIIPYIVKDRTSTDVERGGARDAKRKVRNLVVQQLAHHMTYEKDESPLIIYLKGRPRFKYSDVANPMNAKVAIMECYPADSADKLLTQLKEKFHKPLINRGLYFPKNRPLGDYAQELINLILSGCFQFHTEVDGETFIIKGV